MRRERMDLNWTIEVLSYFIATIILTIGDAMLIYRFVKKNEQYILWFMLGWSIRNHDRINTRVFYLYLNIPLFALSIYISLPGFFDFNYCNGYDLP